MGIKRKNMDEQVIILRASEPVVADDHVDTDFADFDHFVKNIHMECAVVGATGTTSVDVNRDGTTILSAAIDLTADLIPTAYPTVSDANRVGAKGDRYSLDVDAVETTVPQGLIVQLLLARKDPGPTRNDTPVNLT